MQLCTLSIEVEKLSSLATRCLYTSRTIRRNNPFYWMVKSTMLRFFFIYLSKCNPILFSFQISKCKTFHLIKWKIDCEFNLWDYFELQLNEIDIEFKGSFAFTNKRFVLNNSKATTSPWDTNRHKFRRNRAKRPRLAWSIKFSKP